MYFYIFNFLEENEQKEVLSNKLHMANLNQWLAITPKLGDC
jgi:hypothetical protein